MIVKCKDCYYCDFDFCTLLEEDVDIEKEKECEKSIIANPNTRWEKGLKHYLKSIKIAKEIADIDSEHGNYFDFRFGGDGDNGEHLIYLLDCYFEIEQKKC